MQDQESKAKLPSVVWGDWDKETVRLDFDDTSLGEVKLWAYRALKWFRLDGFVILRSSMKEYVVKNKGKVFYRYLKGSYLVIFDKPVKWETNVKVMNWVALESGNVNLQNMSVCNALNKLQQLEFQIRKRSLFLKLFLGLGLKIDKLRSILRLEGLC